MTTAETIKLLFDGAFITEECHKQIFSKWPKLKCLVFLPDYPREVVGEITEEQFEDLAANGFLIDMPEKDPFDEKECRRRGRCCYKINYYQLHSNYTEKDRETSELKRELEIIKKYQGFNVGELVGILEMHLKTADSEDKKIYKRLIKEYKRG